MAEVLLRRGLAEAGIDATVHSAGLISEGVPASAHGVTVMGKRGLDLSEHRSRAVHAHMLERADLIICMARMHVREAALLDRSTFARTFTLKELVRRGEGAGPREQGETLASWIARAAAARRPTDMLGESAADDVADPIGGSLKAYEQTAAELDGLVTRLVALIAPAAREAQLA
jgi:protein-tyrosine phosphatase